MIFVRISQKHMIFVRISRSDRLKIALQIALFGGQQRFSGWLNSAIFSAIFSSVGWNGPHFPDQID